jgi:hypothetical protein
MVRCILRQVKVSDAPRPLFHSTGYSNLPQVVQLRTMPERSSLNWTSVIAARQPWQTRFFAPASPSGPFAFTTLS